MRRHHLAFFSLLATTLCLTPLRPVAGTGPTRESRHGRTPTRLLVDAAAATTSVPTTAPAPPTPAPVPATAPPGAPPLRGRATAWGCAAALDYLRAYADPRFAVLCPHDAQGHDATSCINAAPCVWGQFLIEIADPCPAAYMNEAHNSWVIDRQITGAPNPEGSDTIDPFGVCPR